jgi:hypothetical protein
MHDDAYVRRKALNELAQALEPDAIYRFRQRQNLRYTIGIPPERRARDRTVSRGIPQCHCWLIREAA